MSEVKQGNTVGEIFEAGLAIMSEEKKNAKDYDAYLMGVMNQLLMENYGINNHIRRAYGKPTLDIVPYVREKTDDVPYEAILCRNVLPLGLAAQLFTDDSMQKHGVYYARYYNAQQDADIAVMHSYSSGESGD